MAATTPKVDWSRIVEQMAVDKARLEAAIEGGKPARQQAAFGTRLQYQLSSIYY